MKLAEIMGAGLFKHFKPKKTRKNVQGKNDNVPAENQTLNLAEALVKVSEGPEKYTILSPFLWPETILGTNSSCE